MIIKYSTWRGPVYPLTFAEIDQMSTIICSTDPNPNNDPEAKDKHFLFTRKIFQSKNRL